MHYFKKMVKIKIDNYILCVHLCIWVSICLDLVLEPIQRFGHSRWKWGQKCILFYFHKICQKSCINLISLQESHKICFKIYLKYIYIWPRTPNKPWKLDCQSLYYKKGQAWRVKEYLSGLYEWIKIFMLMITC